MKKRLTNYSYCSLIVLFSAISSVSAQQEQDTKACMYTEINRAFELNQRSKYGEAIVLSNKILVYANKTNDDYLKARVYNTLGNSHYNVNNDSLSFQYLFKSKDLFVKLKDTSRIIIAYNNIGVNHRISNNLEASNTYFRKSLNLAELSNNKKELVYPLFNLGVNLIEKKDPVEKDFIKSYKYLKKAEVLAYKYYQEKAILGEILEFLSSLHHELGDSKKSLEYFNKTLEFATKYNYLEIIALAHSNRAFIYVENKDFEKAYHALDNYVEVNDSIYSMKQFEMAKQIEVDNFLIENKLKLNLIENEKRTQGFTIKKTKIYNLILFLFSVILMFCVYYIFKKNCQLKKAKVIAENLSKTKSDFYSEISHELRTPLYAVIELSNLLLEEDVNVIHREYLESLKFSGNHLLSLINNVLQLNKVESGKMKIELLDFDLKNIISNIIDSLEFALRDSHNTIKLNHDHTIPNLLVGDSLKLSQIFINLISNAIKFTRKGIITVTTRMVKENDDEVVIYFEVADTGLGIPKDKQDQVFDCFYQEQAKIEKSYKGTGLGLSIVKRILTAMDSEIKIESEEGKGSTFYFELSFNKSVNNLIPKEEYAHQLRRLTSYKFLVVDDNRVNRLVTKRILDKLDIESEVVDSGRKAIALLKIKSFDCVLMDLHMPELDGYETTELIRDFNKEIAIVALTAASTEEVELKINKYELNGYILKPFIITEFVETLNRLIKKDTTITQ